MEQVDFYQIYDIIKLDTVCFEERYERNRNRDGGQPELLPRRQDGEMIRFSREIRIRNEAVSNRKGDRHGTEQTKKRA